jgi:putative ABC transport system permease protein
MDNLIAANLRQRPLRTTISVVGVALGVILVVLTVGLARGMTRDAAERQSNVEAEIRFFPGGGFSLAANPLRLSTRYADAIMHGVQPTPEDPDLQPKPPIPGVAAVTPVGEWVQSNVGGIGFEAVDGIDYNSFLKTTHLNIVEGRGLTSEPADETPEEAIVDRYYSETNKGPDGLNTHVGSQIRVLGRSFTVVGIYEPPVLARIKIPLKTLQRLLGGADNCTFLMIKTEKPELAAAAMTALKQYYPGNNILFTRDLPALYSQGIKPVEVFLDVVIGLSMVISGLVILLAMYTTIIERTREIGVLKSLGASKRFIVLVIEKEAALISAMGVAFGFVVSVIGKYAIEGTTRLIIDLQPKWLLISAILGLSCGVIGALYPAFRAAALDPIEALSYE